MQVILCSDLFSKLKKNCIKLETFLGRRLKIVNFQKLFFEKKSGFLYQFFVMFWTLFWCVLQKYRVDNCLMLFSITFVSSFVLGLL